ncbi:MAG: arginine deiminase-related protein, partial [Gammaproteobacteria bacterium]
TLERHGVDVRIFPGRQSIELPDEIFPNNWISTHPDGTVVLYPMMAWNRREERRKDILDQLQQQAGGFRIDRIVDLSHLEQSNHFLEGTGSLVLDHGSRLAFACLSPRTHVEALREFGREMNYDIIAFNAKGRRGRAIYHTNVMMSLGERFAVACLESIPELDDRLRVLMRLERSGREVIELRPEQLRHFCGNLLQLRAGDKRVIVMSKRARQALDEHQVAALGRHGDLVTVDVGTIETFGGGSVRCMLTELLLPRKAQSED